MPFFRICIFLCFTLRAFSQSGCTDPGANNYNSSATSNDGSCTYNASTMASHLKGVLSTSLTESSGVLYLDGAVWTHNDSGNPAEIFKLDTSNGHILQRVFISNHSNTDWEDIAADSTYIYVGDFGNNDGMRTDLKVLRIRRDSIGSASNTTVQATAINFSYADQTSFASNSSNNFDCESLLSIGNSLYLFSKDRGDFKTRVYRLSKTPGTYTLTPYTSFNVNGELTGADYNSAINEVVLIGYLSTKKNSFLWFLNDFSGDQFFSGNKRRVEIGNSTTRWQTEGVAYATANELFVSNETSDYPASLYTMVKNFNTSTGIRELALNDAALKIYPNPVSDLLTVECVTDMEYIQIIASDGRVCARQNVSSNKVTIHTKQFSLANGVYVLKISTPAGAAYRKITIGN